MCNPVIPLGLLGAMTKAAAPVLIGGIAGYQLRKSNEKGNAKAEAQTQNKIDAANQAAQEQIEANRLANSVQSTSELEALNLQQKLAAQKVPLNTINAGLAVGNGLSSGLNLGGY